jgi:transcriptional regulator with XRE-family HTH domain
MAAMEFGERVRERRMKEGLSQTELAETVGISRTYLSEIERGVATNLSWGVVRRLATALGIQVEQEPSKDQDLASLPPGLADFADSKKLPRDDVLMLARLKFRGKQPTTSEKWELLYNVIKMATE